MNVCMSVCVYAVAKKSILANEIRAIVHLF
jgi:hypothetical protein